MTPTPQTGLAKVQHLYVMQIELMKLFAEDLKDPTKRKEARKCLTEFSKLLKEADWRYMGGEDVYDALHMIQKEFAAKLNRSTGSRISGSSKKSVVSKQKVIKKKAAPKKKPTKKVLKKVAAKKKASPKKKKQVSKTRKKK